MKIKELFKQLKEHNLFQENFNFPTHAYRIYFNDYDRKFATTYGDMMRYIRKEYTSEFVKQIENIDLQKCADGSFYATFIANGVGCSIEISIA